MMTYTRVASASGRVIRDVGFMGQTERHDEVLQPAVLTAGSLTHSSPMQAQPLMTATSVAAFRCWHQAAPQCAQGCGVAHL
jgi:hypothetical protein